MPVITITMYWGPAPWDGPRSLHDMLGCMDADLKKFVSDYRINLVVPQEIENFEKFRTSLGEVLEIIKVSEDKEAMKELLASNPKYMQMDNESVSAINTFIGVDIPISEERGVTNMCKAWEDQREEGREEERESLIKSMLSRGRTSKEIAEFTGIPQEEIQLVEQSISVNS